MPSSFALSFSFFSLFLLSLIFSTTNAIVPHENTFKYVNEGEFGEYIVEYQADYRVLSVFTSPFELCFYNTTPNAFTLALRMGTRRSESLRRWVWEANRGKPVRENATLTLGSDGNLVLAEADGSIVWQTNTANKGVVGFQLLSTGNMVLHDAKGKFIWQSFDYPTDTLLVGQSLRVGGTTKLVSRASKEQNINGPYSLVLEPKGLVMYYKSQNAPKPVVYFKSFDWFRRFRDSLQYITFNSTHDEGFIYDLTLDYSTGNSSSSSSGSIGLARPKYNATLTYLRLEIDGNLRLYTYDDTVDWGAWEVTFTLFSRDSDRENECQLPERCGKLGVCSNNQCVACPTSNGLMGWSEECAPKKVTSCKPSDITYYKIEGVDHFMSKYTRGNGPTKVNDCERKCTSDCKCLGYFYHQENSRCWIAYDLMTLTKVSNSSHVGYIKTPKFEGYFRKMISLLN